jgi:hypothetical protein
MQRYCEAATIASQTPILIGLVKPLFFVVLDNPAGWFVFLARRQPEIRIGTCDFGMPSVLRIL